MKKILLIALTAIWALTSNAYDFKVDGVCYNKNADGTSVTVTYEERPASMGRDFDDPSYSSLQGDLIIPSEVTCEGVPYKVSVIGNSAYPTPLH